MNDEPAIGEAAVENVQVWETLITDEDDALAPGGPTAIAWDALWHSSHEATVFQHRAWLSAWWAAYGRPGRLRLILVRRHGVPVAGVALYQTPHDPLRRLRLVGEGLSDFGDVLLAGSDHGAAASRLADAIADLGRPVDLRETASGSAAARMTELFPRRTEEYPDSTCLELSARNWQELITALPNRTASRVRAKARKIDRLGVRAELIRPAEAAAGVDMLLRLHAEQWRGRGINPEHLSGRFAALLRSAVPELMADGCADLVRFETGGETVACDLLLHWEGTVAEYLYGALPDLRDRIDLATLFVRQGMGVVERRDAKTYTLLRGREPYKQRWRPTSRVNRRLVLAGAPTAGLATAVLATAASGRVAATRSVRALRQRVGHR